MFMSILQHLSGLLLFSLIFYLGVNFPALYGTSQKRGFFCGDLSLRYPDLWNTINRKALYIIGVAVPLVVVTLCELMIIRSRRTLFLVFGRLHAILLPFLYGFAMERLLKNVGKNVVGRLRPFFYEVCQPYTPHGPACDFEPHPHNQLSPFITNYRCTSPLASSTLFTSFPSGHASLAFYGMVFTALYLQRFSRLWVRKVSSFALLLPLAQMMCLVLAFAVAVSRVLDYKHFVSDVVAGSLLGTTVAIVVVFYSNKALMEAGKQREQARDSSAGSISNEQKNPTTTCTIDVEV